MSDNEKLWRKQAKGLTDDELKILIDHLEGSDWDGEYERVQQRRRIRIYQVELGRRTKGRCDGTIPMATPGELAQCEKRSGHRERLCRAGDATFVDRKRTKS